MPFTEPIRGDDPTETVRMIARLASLLLELRTEYERRPRPHLLLQIKERVVEMQGLVNLLPIEGEPNRLLPPGGE